MDTTCKSLIIDKIVLNNFKTFFGKNEIILGCSSEKFVNLIIGPCGSGKTTIAYALQWVFKVVDLQRAKQCSWLSRHRYSWIRGKASAHVLFLTSINN